MRADWHHLGVRLGILHSTLYAIRAAHDRDLRMCLLAVIDTWLRRPKGEVRDDVRPTWRSLCEALSHINGPLAETIASQHQCGYINPIGGHLEGIVFITFIFDFIQFWRFLLNNQVQYPPHSSLSPVGVVSVQFKDGQREGPVKMRILIKHQSYW